jgi:hypothetical protein
VKSEPNIYEEKQAKKARKKSKIRFECASQSVRWMRF